MDDQEISNSDNEYSTPPPSHLPPGFAALAAMMEEQARAGWVWDEKAHTLACPKDRQLYFSIDLLTRKLSLSEKLASRLNEGLGPQPEEEQP